MNVRPGEEGIKTPKGRIIAMLTGPPADGTGVEKRDHQLRSSARSASISALLCPGVEGGCCNNHSRADWVFAWDGLLCVLALGT